MMIDTDVIKLQAENRKLKRFLNIIKNQDECFRHGKYITCKGLENITEEEKEFEMRLADNLCPHCIARLSFQESK